MEPPALPTESATMLISGTSLGENRCLHPFNDNLLRGIYRLSKIWQSDSCRVLKAISFSGNFVDNSFHLAQRIRLRQGVKKTVILVTGHNRIIGISA